MSTVAPTKTASSTRPLQVAIIGNPNTGKSTLFNSLAGIQSRVGNYPGVTVEKKVGRVCWEGRDIHLVDLPGTYSLSPRSLDEMVSVDVLLGRQADIGTLDGVVCIVDASNLERNLYLVSQVLDLGLPTVLVLNMWDVAQQRGITIDVESLEQKLGIPVVVTEAHRREGVDGVRQAIAQMAKGAGAMPLQLFPASFYEQCERLDQRLAASGLAKVPSYLIERMLLDAGGQIETQLKTSCSDLPIWLAQSRSELIESGCRIPAVEAKVRYNWAREMTHGAVSRPAQRPVTFSDRLDRVLTHRISGLVIFCVLMFVIFQAIYTWAGPFMGWIEATQGWVAALVEGLLGPGALRSLLTDGVIAGVGGVVVFLPQIVFLFLFIAILEDCGYMARAAFVMDKLMTKVGLSGKSFVPLMSSFACAVPGVMATRVIENRRERMVTILVAPLMSCSARLPVYLLLIGAFIPPTTYLGGWVTLHGLVLFAMSSVGALVAIPVAWTLKKTWFRGEAAPFVLELPSYKWPSPRIVLSRVYDRAKAFLARAGTLILGATIVVWAAGYFPGDHSELENVTARIEQLQTTSGDDDVSSELTELTERRNRLGGQLIAGSFLGRVGHVIEPVVQPLGWDWRIGVGVIASFPAREVVIATLGTIYSLGGDVDESDEGLMNSMHSATWADGNPVYNVPVALSIMVFFALCAQCAATLVTIWRETNHWGWPAFAFLYMTLLAYVGALIAYQVGMLFA
ncbi:MAG: ferrous iron transport protein B [Planctomycetes bacterium]|nr:ferrous iron transport protein B [Planctomycetota bacterium]